MMTGNPALAAILNPHSERIKQAMHNAPILPDDFTIACVRFAGAPDAWTAETSACVTNRMGRVLLSLGIVQEAVSGRKPRRRAQK